MGWNTRSSATLPLDRIKWKLMAKQVAITADEIDRWTTVYAVARQLSDSAVGRAHASIEALVREGLVDEAIASRGRQLANYLFSGNTIDASIAPDGDGLSFYWVAREWSIEIDVYPANEYWWSVRNVAADTYSDGGRELPVERLRYSLNQFSKEVDAENPDWRSTIR